MPIEIREWMKKCKRSEGGGLVQIGDLVRLASSTSRVGQWQTPPFVMGNIFQGAPPIPLLYRRYIFYLYILPVILFYKFQFVQTVPVIFHIKSCIVGVHLIEYESLKVDASGKQRWRAIVKSFSNVNKS